MNENQEVMEMEQETINNEVETTDNESGGLGILVAAGAFALGAAAVAGGKKAYSWFKNRKHKPEVVEGDVHCVNDDISNSDEESVKG